MSIEQPSVPGAATTPRGGSAHRLRRLGIGAGVVVFVVALTVWSLAGIHVDGALDVQHAGHSTACAENPLDEPGDLTLALGIGKDLAFRPQDVRLIAPKNLTLSGAYVGLIEPRADGAYTLPPLSAGWPTLGDSAITSLTLVPAVGADVTGPSQHALVLRLHVDDPKADAGFQDIGLVYRSGLIRHEKRLGYAQQLIAGRSCP